MVDCERSFASKSGSEKAVYYDSLRNTIAGCMLGVGVDNIKNLTANCIARRLTATSVSYLRRLAASSSSSLYASYFVKVRNPETNYQMLSQQLQDSVDSGYFAVLLKNVSSSYNISAFSDVTSSITVEDLTVYPSDDENNNATGNSSNSDNYAITVVVVIATIVPLITLLIALYLWYHFYYRPMIKRVSPQTEKQEHAHSSPPTDHNSQQTLLHVYNKIAPMEGLSPIDHHDSEVLGIDISQQVMLCEDRLYADKNCQELISSTAKSYSRLASQSPLSSFSSSAAAAEANTTATAVTADGIDVAALENVVLVGSNTDAPVLKNDDLSLHVGIGSNAYNIIAYVDDLVKAASLIHSRWNVHTAADDDGDDDHDHDDDSWLIEQEMDLDVNDDGNYDKRGKFNESYTTSYVDDLVMSALLMCSSPKWNEIDDEDERSRNTFTDASSENDNMIANDRAATETSYIVTAFVTDIVITALCNHESTFVMNENVRERLLNIITSEVESEERGLIYNRIEEEEEEEEDEYEEEDDHDDDDDAQTIASDEVWVDSTCTIGDKSTEGDDASQESGSSASLESSRDCDESLIRPYVDNDKDSEGDDDEIEEDQDMEIRLPSLTTVKSIEDDNSSISISPEAIVDIRSTPTDNTPNPNSGQSEISTSIRYRSDIAKRLMKGKVSNLKGTSGKEDSRSTATAASSFASSKGPKNANLNKQETANASPRDNGLLKVYTSSVKPIMMESKQQGKITPAPAEAQPNTTKNTSTNVVGYKSSSSPSSSKVSPLRSHVAKLSNPFTRLLGKESEAITSEVYDNNIIPISTIAAAATPTVASQNKSSTRTAKVSPHKGGGGGGAAADGKRPAQKQLTHPLTTSVIKTMTLKIKAAMSPTMKSSSKKTDQKLTTKLLPNSDVSTMTATTSIATKTHNLFDYMFRDTALPKTIVDEKQVHHLPTQSSLEDNEQMLSSTIISNI